MVATEGKSGNANGNVKVLFQVSACVTSTDTQLDKASHVAGCRESEVMAKFTTSRRGKELGTSM